MERQRKQGRGGARIPRWKVGMGALLAVLAGVLVFSLAQIFTIQLQRGAARQTYDELRRLKPAAQAASASGAALHSGAAASERTLAEVNEEYVGWLTLPGTAVDYPVVQGADNSKYLKRTFDGTYNPAGAIFMDCTVAADFSARHTVIYGHNMKDGSMFGSLHRYLDADFLRQNPMIAVTLPDGGVRSYRIFAARQVLADDWGYRLSFSDDADYAAFTAALGAAQTPAGLLTLSTCGSAGGDNRVLVHAALVAG